MPFDEQPPPQSRPARGSATPWLLLFLVLAIAGAAGYFGYGLYSTSEEQRAAALKASDEAQKKLAALTATHSELEASLKMLEAQKTALEASVQAKDSELAALKATADSLQQKMQAEIDKGDIKISQHGQRIQVDLVDKILFDSGKAEVTSKGEEVLMKLGEVLSGVEGKLIHVSGHTDDSPIVKDLQLTFPSNWELSAARAVNVVRVLAEKGHVKGTKLIAAGYGQYHPIASNGTPAGRARNRRIEVLLTPELEIDQAAQPAQATAPAPKSAVVSAKSAVVSASAKKKH